MLNVRGFFVIPFWLDLTDFRVLLWLTGFLANFAYSAGELNEIIRLCRQLEASRDDLSMKKVIYALVFYCDLSQAQGL